MSDDDLIEQVARAICIARGADPDKLVMGEMHAPVLLDRYALKMPDDWYQPLWRWKLPEAGAAFVCIRDLRGIKGVEP